jgi:hypothetical protein
MESLEKYWPIIITMIAIVFMIALVSLLSHIEQAHVQISVTEQKILNGYGSIFGQKPTHVLP